MTEGIAETMVRLAVDGPRGRVDISTPLWADVAAVLRSYAVETGEDDPLALVTLTGRVLDPGSSVQRLGLRPGDLLIAVATHPDDVEMTSIIDVRSLRRDDTVPVPAWVPVVTAVVATIAALLAAGAAALLDMATTRTAVSAILFLLVIAVPLLGGTSARLRPWVVALPSFAGAAALVVTADTGPGDVLLTIGATGLGAATAAAYARAVAPRLADDELLVWLVSGATVAVVAVSGLLLESSGTAAWAVLLLLAVVASRILPTFAVDVPDHVLIDFERLAITAWSARERPRRPRRGIVRADDVADVAHHGATIVSAGVIAVTLVASASSALLLASAASGPTLIGARIMVVATGISLALGARSYRARVPRTVLRVAGATLLAWSVALLVVAGGGSWQPAAAAIATAAGLLVTMAGLALGRGWRSVWWGRVSEVVEGLSVVLVIGAATLATGLFETIRQLSA